MICRHCGANIPNNSVFCPSCNESVIGNQQENGVPPYNDPNFQNSQPKKSYYVPALVLAIISIVAALLVPIAGIALGIVSIVLALKGKDRISLFMGAVGIGIGVVTWIINIIILLGAV